MNNITKNPQYPELEWASWLHTLSEKKIQEGKSIVELASYENFSLWWTAISEVFLTMSGRLLILDRSYISNKFSSGFFFKIFYFFEPIYRLILLAIAKIIYLMQLSKKKNKKSQYKIMIVSLDKAWRDIWNVSEDKYVKRDIHYDSLIQELSDKYGAKIISVAPMEHLRNLKSLSLLFNRAINQKQGIHIPFDLYWSFAIYNKQKTVKLRFEKTWELLKNNKNFRTLFVNKGEDKYPLIEKRVEHYFNYHFPFMVKNIEMAKALLEKERPDILIMPASNGWYWQAMIIAAKMKGIPILETQHGIVSPNVIDYFCNKSRVKKGPNSRFMNFPDKFAVYGQWTKNILMDKFNYPEDKIIVIGQPRYDLLVKSKELFSRQKFCQKYGLDSKKKLVLFATRIAISPFVEQERLIIRALKEITDIELIIKSHPRGKMKDYVKICREEEIKARIIPEDCNIFEAISVCDIVITHPSTIVIESIIANRPTAVLDISNRPFPIPWTESGAALSIYRTEDIPKILNKALFDKAAEKDMAIARKKFSYHYAYKQDGKATERMAQLVVDMVKNSRSQQS